jgi:hypothetical protein
MTYVYNRNILFGIFDKSESLYGVVLTIGLLSNSLSRRMTPMLISNSVELLIDALFSL